jgi:hypothetical protein
MKVSYDELHDVVFNTLDFCGSPMRAAKEHCRDEGFEFSEREQKIVLRLQGEYNDSVSDKLPAINWG